VTKLKVTKLKVQWFAAVVASGTGKKQLRPQASTSYRRRIGRTSRRDGSNLFRETRETESPVALTEPNDRSRSVPLETYPR
jgi:hypothetical protein